MKTTRIFMVCAWLLLCVAGPALAENINPDDDDSKYAWSENTGWINAEPLGRDGPGAGIGSGVVNGFLRSENIGWISLSSTNSGAAVDYGVMNDGLGNLSGYAWSENAGWIKFASASPIAFKVQTSWPNDVWACFIEILR